MKLYADYIKERENVEIEYNEVAFMTYKKETENSVTIFEAYVSPDYRRSDITKNLFNKICNNTKANIAYTMTDSKANGCEVSEKVIFSLGFKVLKKDKTITYYVKEILNG